MTLYRDRLQAGVRQYLHRMIICLGDELLKAIPLAVSLLLKDAQVLLYYRLNICRGGPNFHKNT